MLIFQAKVDRIHQLLNQTPVIKALDKNSSTKANSPRSAQQLFAWDNLFTVSDWLISSLPTPFVNPQYYLRNTQHTFNKYSTHFNVFSFDNHFDNNYIDYYERANIKSNNS